MSISWYTPCIGGIHWCSTHAGNPVCAPSCECRSVRVTSGFTRWRCLATLVPHGAVYLTAARVFLSSQLCPSKHKVISRSKYCYVQHPAIMHLPPDTAEIVVRLSRVVKARSLATLSGWTRMDQAHLSFLSPVQGQQKYRCRQFRCAKAKLQWFVQRALAILPALLPTREYEQCEHALAASYHCV